MYTSILEDETTKLSLNQITCYVVSYEIRIRHPHRWEKVKTCVHTGE